MRCFVTGVAGFVGSHLAERLLADGHEVCGIDSFTSDYDRRLKERNLEGPRSWNTFQFVESDLVEAALQPLLEGIDWIFHQAWQEKEQPISASLLTRHSESNVQATLHLLEAARRFGWVQRFVYASSSAVYGKAAHLPIHENELERPYSPYGVTKLAAENLCSLYYSRFGLPTTSLRYFTVYGPRQRPNMAFHRFCKAIVCNEPLYLYEGGYQTRDFIYVQDVVEANIRAAEVGEAAGQILNIASGTSVTLRSIIKLLEEISGSQINVVTDDSQHDDVRHICADTQRAQQLLDFHPCMGLLDGLTYEFEFIRDLYKHWPSLSAKGPVHQISSDVRPIPSDDQTVIKKDQPINLKATEDFKTNQTYKRVAGPTSDLLAPTEATKGHQATPKQRVVLKSGTDQAASQAFTAVEAASDYVATSNTIAVNLTVVPESEMIEVDTNTAKLVTYTILPIQEPSDCSATNQATTINSTAIPQPETIQDESQTTLEWSQIDQANSDVIAPDDTLYMLEDQTGFIASIHLEQQTIDASANNPIDKEDEQDEQIIILPPPFTGMPTHPWVRSGRPARPASGYAEENQIGVAIIALLLIGLLIVGGCLAVYTQFNSPQAITSQQGAASSAAIMITANTGKMLKNTFSLTAVTDDPDTTQHQIKARQVTATTQPVSKSIQISNGSDNNANQSTDNGDNSTTSPVVQQSDIDAAAGDLESANKPSAVSILQSRLAPNEQLVGNPQCQPQVTADHQAGDTANWVTVTVVFSCSGEAYDRGAAQEMAAQELAEQAKKDLGDQYALSGQIKTIITGASVSDADQNTITVSVEAHGTWVLQLSAKQQQSWANALAGKTREAAQNFLLQQRGIKQANIHLQGGNGDTLPTDAKKITFKVQPIANS